MWVYDTTDKLFPFRLTYEMEVFLFIKLKVMTLQIITKMIRPLDKSQHQKLLQFNELDKMMFRT